MNDFPEDSVWMPQMALPGEQTMVYRQSRFREVAGLSIEKKRRKFDVRAIVTDNPPPYCGTLDEILSYAPRNRFTMPDGSFSVWKHYGKKKAVFFDLAADEAGRLARVHVEVSAIRPELALGYARAAVNQLLDSLTVGIEHPLTIQRLELISPNDGGITAYQITLPCQEITRIVRFGGIGPGAMFSGLEAILREAATNPSPYYRLLLAYRGFDGTDSVRSQIAAFFREHKVSAPKPTSLKIDVTELAQLGFGGKVLELKNLNDLVKFYREFRNAVAHFFVDQGSAGKGHLQFSSTMALSFAKVSALLLKYLRKEVLHLKAHYNEFMVPLIHVGMILPVEQARERYMVVCPDEETGAAHDEFN